MTMKQKISEWFDEGLKLKASHLIVVCDTFSHDNYPVYTESEERARIEYKEHHAKDMQKVMEVYNLSLSKSEQLSKGMCFNF